MKNQLHKYLAACQGFTVPKADVDIYSEGILDWWRTNGNSFPVWAHAARIVFAISPNSAACERIFALLKAMYGDEQYSTLADAMQAALMLRHHDRRVG